VCATFSAAGTATLALTTRDDRLASGGVVAADAATNPASVASYSPSNTSKPVGVPLPPLSIATEAASDVRVNAESGIVILVALSSGPRTPSAIVRELSVSSPSAILPAVAGVARHEPRRAISVKEPATSAQST
jgi:hypothetical protein